MQHLLPEMILESKNDRCYKYIWGTFIYCYFLMYLLSSQVVFSPVQTREGAAAAAVLTEGSNV